MYRMQIDIREVENKGWPIEQPVYSRQFAKQYTTH